MSSECECFTCGERFSTSGCDEHTARTGHAEFRFMAIPGNLNNEGELPAGENAFLDKSVYVAQPIEPAVRIGPSALVASLEKIEYEFYERNEGFLSGISVLFSHAQKLQDYMDEVLDFKGAAKIALKLIELIYYMQPDEYNLVRHMAEGDDFGEGSLVENPELESSMEFFRSCVSLISRFGDECELVRAKLLNAYHCCLIDEFYEARNLLVESPLGNQMDEFNQILFNRTIAQLGLCAFRLGLISEGHDYLARLHSTGRVEESLGQGVQRSRHEGNIDVELLLCVYLICAMLLEVPNMASSSDAPVISHTFRDLLRASESRVYGDDGDVTAIIMRASRALRGENYQTSFMLIKALPSWRHLKNSDDVQLLLRKKLKEAAAKVYIHTHDAPLHTQANLASLFELPEEEISNILSSI